MRQIIFILLFFKITFLIAQEANVKSFKKELNWYEKEPIKDKILGITSEKTYSELLNASKPIKTIIVAVIDGGVDIKHEDLVGQIWENTKEIPNNNIDDDQNGYIDDVHGWNFLGNSKGENVEFECYEYTRLYKIYLQNPKTDDPILLQAKDLYQKELEKQKEENIKIDAFERRYNEAKSILFSATGRNVQSLGDIEFITPKNAETNNAKNFLYKIYSDGFTEKMLKELKQHNIRCINKHLNTSFEPRKIIADNTKDIKDNKYGNPDIIGPNSTHGTACAGLIAAIRNNGIGINGIATNVKIMPIRAVPEGDERDKDIALAIRYAVDNGASIINMSFGKALSPERQMVEEAIKYAEQKGVLLVHAAGNDSQDMDIIDNYPSDKYINGVEATNFINIGASSLRKKKAVCTFSNFGKQRVDLFAPGEELVVLDTTNTYQKSQGTSFAAPIVSGVCALILSYYPDLKPNELIDVLIKSANVLKKTKVYIPNKEIKKRKKTLFENLSRSGGIINVYSAFSLLQTKQNK